MAQTDREALVALYNATGGPSWKKNRNWNTDANLSQWHGIETNVQGRVVGLTLSSNNLQGAIPEALGALRKLQTLDLSINQLSGTIPAALGALSNLTELSLFGNKLTGPILPELGKLTALRTLNLYGNQLSGLIPAELGKLAALEYLNLDSNSFSGPIPAELGHLAALKEPRLWKNQLSGAGGAIPITGRVAVAKHEYVAHGPEQLSFQVGDIVQLHTDKVDSRGWGLGQANGKVGWFPGDFVDMRPSADERESRLSGASRTPGGSKTPAASRNQMQSGAAAGSTEGGGAGHGQQDSRGLPSRYSGRNRQQDSRGPAPPYSGRNRQQDSRGPAPPYSGLNQTTTFARPLVTPSGAGKTERQRSGSDAPAASTGATILAVKDDQALPTAYDEREYVVAIHLGTSCTAYSWKSAPDSYPSVGVPDMGPHEDVVRGDLTAILIGGSTGVDRSFKPSRAEAYGRVAQRRYAENDIPQGAQLFERFVMQLHHKPDQQGYDDLVETVTRSASRRAEMRLMDIFVIALEYIKKAALQRMCMTHEVQEDNITWVLTVPVGCSEPAKYFIRTAAIRAGFGKGGDTDFCEERIVLCMEPIAACLALGDRLSWKIHDKYLVIDCGEGTVDISSFRVINTSPPKLDRVGKVIGGAWGSAYVDKQFEGFLEDFVTSAAQDAGNLARSSFFTSSAVYRILQGWKRARSTLESVDHDCRVDLSELSREPLEVDMESIDYARKLKNSGGQERVGGDGTWDLVLRPALLRKLFKPQCDRIMEAVSNQLDAPHLHGLTSVVMVGGFSGSVHVQAAVRASLRSKYPASEVNLEVARNPDLTIVQGAAHFVQLQPKAGAQTQQELRDPSTSDSSARLTSTSTPMSAESIAAWTAEEKESLRRQIAGFRGLHELARQNASTVEEVRKLIPEHFNSSFARTQDGGDSPACQESLKELDNLVRMAKVLQELAVAKAEDTEIQRKELALVPGSMQEVYYAFLRGGMCSSYLAANVIASDMVVTSQTGAMGTAGKALNLLAGVVPIAPGLTTLAAGLKEGDRFLQTRNIIKITDMAADVVECCALARRVALRLSDALTADSRSEPNSPQHFSCLSFERFGQGASVDGTNVDGEAAMEWFVEEVLSGEASSQGKNKSPSAKEGQRKGKLHLKKLLKAVGRGCVREARDTDAKVEVLVRIILPSVEWESGSSPQGLREGSGHAASPAHPARSAHPAPPVLDEAGCPPDGRGGSAEAEVDMAALQEQIRAMQADVQATKERNAKLESEVKNLKKHVVKSAPEAVDWGPSGGGQALKQRAVVTETVDGVFERAQARTASEQAATQGQVGELEQVIMERFRETEANVAELQMAADAEKNKKNRRRRPQGRGR